MFFKRLIPLFCFTCFFIFNIYSAEVIPLKKGTFNFTSILQEKEKSIHISGQSPDKTTLLLPVSHHIYSNFEEFIIENVSIILGETKTEADPTILTFKSGDKITFHNCVFHSIHYSMTPEGLEEIRQMQRRRMEKAQKKSLKLTEIEKERPLRFILFKDINQVTFDTVCFYNIKKDGGLPFLGFSNVKDFKMNRARIEETEAKWKMNFRNCPAIQIINGKYINNAQSVFNFQQSSFTFENNLVVGGKIPLRSHSFKFGMKGNLQRNVFYDVEQPLSSLLPLSEISPDLIEKKLFKVENNFFWKTPMPLPYIEEEIARLKWKNNYFWHNPQHYPGNYLVPLKITKPDNLEEDPVIQKFLNGEDIIDEDLQQCREIHVTGNTPQERGENLQAKVEKLLEKPVPFGTIYLPPEDIRVNLVIPYGGITLKGVPGKTRIINDEKSLGELGATPDFFNYSRYSPLLDRSMTTFTGQHHSMEGSLQWDAPFSIKFKEANAHLLIESHVFDVEFVQKQQFQPLMYVGPGTIFTGCRFEGSTWGIFPVNADVSFEDCQFQSFTWQVLDIRGMNWIWLNRCLFKDNILLEDIKKELPQGLKVITQTRHPPAATPPIITPPNIINIFYEGGTLTVKNSVFKDNFVKEKSERHVPQAVLDHTDTYPMLIRDEIVFQGMRPIMLRLTPFVQAKDSSHSLLVNFPVKIYNTLFINNALLPVKPNSCGMLSFYHPFFDEHEQDSDSKEYIPIPTKFVNCIFYKNPLYSQEDRYQDPSYRDVDPETEPAITYRNCLTTHRFSWSEGNVGNIAGDPLWRVPERDDFTPMPDSPLIDAGTSEGLTLPEKDIHGNHRMVDGTGDGIAEVDIGPVEWQGEE